jgi:hypothetical protein
MQGEYNYQQASSKTLWEDDNIITDEDRARPTKRHVHERAHQQMLVTTYAYQLAKQHTAHHYPINR